MAGRAPDAEPTDIAGQRGAAKHDLVTSVGTDTARSASRRDVVRIPACSFAAGEDILVHEAIECSP